VSSSNLRDSRFRFGEFAADVQAGELYRNGSKVKLQGQPFEVLAVLLECPERMVTREELQTNAKKYLRNERSAIVLRTPLNAGLADPAGKMEVA